MTAAPARLATAHRLTIAVIALAAFAAGIGLFMPGVYRETAWMIPQNRDQDLVTLVALAVLSLAAAGLGRSMWFFKHCRG